MKIFSTVRIMVTAAVSVIMLTDNLYSQPAKKVIAFYSTTVERDHVDFAQDAIKFLTDLALRQHFHFDTTTNWSLVKDSFLRNYNLIVWLNDFPQNEQQRQAFTQYMQHGGGWLGFHVAAYNDKDTQWPWFVDFLGGAVFYTNNWPPLPAKLTVDKPAHPICKGIPASFKAPINEWYQWRPSPRLNKNVQVLLSLDASNYPLGKKDIITEGDLPVVWTNTKYRMLYMNMGHGDQIFTDSIQNKLIANAVDWLLQKR